jgi:beta-phosphoglucomutase-like phosphatase (HAD superfamily)
LYAANAISAEVSDCIVVEDSIAGVTAARNAGMRSIVFVGGSHCGPGHSDKLLEAGAETVIDDLRLLLDEVV